MGLGLVTVRSGRKQKNHDALRAIASFPFRYLSWLTANVWICNGQPSSEICCDKHALCIYPSKRQPPPSAIREGAMLC